MFRYCWCVVVVQEPGAATEEVDVVGDAEIIGKSEHKNSIWLVTDGR